MKKVSLVLLVLVVSVVCFGCPGIGKFDKVAADAAILSIQEKYPEDVLEIKIFRDKMQIAFRAGAHPTIKSQIFMEAASIWWSGYPKDNQPRHKLYCWAYDDVISDDDVGALTLQRGSGDYPRILGQPGIYSLRDVK